MTMRMIAVAFTAMISVWLLVPEAVSAQGTRDACSKVCDCNFECLDFCPTDSCNRPSACKRRVDGMAKACQKTCDRCQKMSRSKK